MSTTAQIRRATLDTRHRAGLSPRLPPVTGSTSVINGPRRNRPGPRRAAPRHRPAARRSARRRAGGRAAPAGDPRGRLGAGCARCAGTGPGRTAARRGYRLRPGRAVRAGAGPAARAVGRATWPSCSARPPASRCPCHRAGAADGGRRITLLLTPEAAEPEGRPGPGGLPARGRPPTAITIPAEAAAGLFYGVQTLRQLLPAGRSKPAPRCSDGWEVPGGPDRRPPPLRLPGRDARRRPALLPRRRRAAVHRPPGPLQAQPPAPAPHRRPGLADRRSTPGPG